MRLFPVFIGLFVPLSLTASAATTLEDFEGGNSSGRWTFSNGAEFPGARGTFAPDTGAAHAGAFGGKLSFDFTGGGNYVSALLKMPETSGHPAEDWKGLRLWLKRPEGNNVSFRYTDSAGQTFQKMVECAADRWVQVTIPFGGWTGHWGGADDGKVRGRPRTLALNIDHGSQTAGALLFDDLELINDKETTARITYQAYDFASEEGWGTRAEGNPGATRLNGRLWETDFSQGARWLSLGVPDHVLLGNVDRIRLRVRGSAKGHPVRLVVRTHFMTFQKEIGQLNGNDEQELVTDGPPGPGWEWHGGENDGKIHGPLRLAEIGLGRGTGPARCSLELRGLLIEASCPPGKRCVLLAGSTGVEADAHFSVQARALSDLPMSGQLQWVLRDWAGHQVEQGRQTLSLPPKAEPFTFNLPITESARAGRKFLEAEFNLEIPGQDVPAARAAWVANLTEPGDARLDPESPFGMGVYLSRYGGDTAGLELMEHAARVARDAGVKWSREDFSWGRIEPQPGRFDWTYYDHLVACARRNGISVYAIVGYWSSWTKPYTSQGIDEYVHFVKALVDHYRADIKQWEIWNEPNIFFWDGPKDLYAELLTRSYAAIKEIDPQAQVLGLSTAGIDHKFISRMLELKAPFDVLTIHPYRKFLDDAAFIDDLKKVSAQVQRPDAPRRPVWLTEMGWSTCSPHNTLRQDFAPTTLRAQAQLIARSYLCAIVSGVEPRTFWYDFRNDGVDPIYFEDQMGIVYHDFRPKPAYNAYATLTRVLRGKRLAGPVSAPQGVLAFEFRTRAGESGSTIAVWSSRPNTTVELPVSAPRVTCVNTIGEETQLQAQAGKISLELQQDSPVYLLEP